MKKYLFIVVAALGMLLTGCKTTSVLNPSYPLVNSPVFAELQPNLQIGGQVSTTVHFTKLAMLILKPDFDINKTMNGAEIGKVSFFSKFQDPLAAVRGAIVYKALEGTSYDVLVAPIYTVERNGLKYTVTVKGYGAKITGVKQN